MAQSKTIDWTKSKIIPVPSGQGLPRGAKKVPKMKMKRATPPRRQRRLTTPSTNNTYGPTTSKKKANAAYKKMRSLKGRDKV